MNDVIRVEAWAPRRQFHGVCEALGAVWMLREHLVDALVSVVG